MKLEEIVNNLKVKGNITDQICLGYDDETNTYTINGKIVESEYWKQIKNIWDIPVSYNCNKFFIEKNGYTTYDIIHSRTDKNSLVFIYKT